MSKHAVSSPLILSESTLPGYVGGRGVTIAARIYNSTARTLTFVFTDKKDGSRRAELTVKQLPSPSRPDPELRYISAGMVLDTLNRIRL